MRPFERPGNPSRKCLKVVVVWLIANPWTRHAAILSSFAEIEFNGFVARNSRNVVPCGCDASHALTRVLRDSIKTRLFRVIGKR